MAFIRKNCGIKRILEVKNRRGKKNMNELKRLEAQRDDEIEIDLGEFSFIAE